MTPTLSLEKSAKPIAARFPLLSEPWPEFSVRSELGDLAQARLVLTEAERVIRAQEERIRQLENMALTDELTGLLNRRGVMLALRRELAAARRDEQASGVLALVDLDGFKAINDRLGHAAGDSYLQTVAAALGEGVRESDVVARLGGDEFAVLFTRIEESAGIERVKKLERFFNSRTTAWGKETLPLRASFGVSPYSGSDAPESVLASADLKLYAHKAERKRSARG